MVNNSYKSKAKDLVLKAKNKGLITKYSEFCRTKLGKSSSLTQEEIKYYTSISKEVK